MRAKSCHRAYIPSAKDQENDSRSEKSSEGAGSKKLDAAKLAAEQAGQVSPALSENGDTTNERNVVSFGQDDKTSPYNWPRGKKLYVVITGMVMVLNSTMGSALPSGITGAVQKYWNIQNEEYLVLPVSIYLIGYILGPLIFAPLSESYGRKIVMICTFVMFTMFVMACAVAPNFASYIVFRMLAGIGASTPVSVIGGIYADLYSTPRARGLAITCFMAGTTWGPLLGPLISGFVSLNLSWRWVFWIELIFAGITWPLLLFMPETYGPVILRRRAKALRKKTGNSSIVAQSELEKQDLWELITVVLTRPLRMMFCEAIVSSTCIYLSLEYGIFYIFFQAFQPGMYTDGQWSDLRGVVRLLYQDNTLPHALAPLAISLTLLPRFSVFGDTYGFNPGEVGLAFLPIGVGSVIAAAIYLWWDYYLDKAQHKTKPPAWSQKEEFVRLPLACFGGPLIVISLFWLGWTARPDIHWIVPIMSALPFGVGFLLIFMALINYVVDAYEIFAASAMGATSAARSTFGVVLPFAAKPLFSNLGVAWACTLLGILSALTCLIPFVFIRYGAKIRANSKFCQELKQKKVENEEKQQRLWERQRSQKGSRM